MQEIRAIIAANIARLRLESGQTQQELAAKHLEMPTRPQTVAYRMLARHAEYCEGMAESFIEKALGHDKYATELFEAFRDRFGKHEVELDRWMDFGQSFKALEPYIKTVHAAKKQTIEV